MKTLFIAVLLVTLGVAASAAITPLAAHNQVTQSLNDLLELVGSLEPAIDQPVLGDQLFVIRVQGADSGIAIRDAKIAGKSRALTAEREEAVNFLTILAVTPSDLTGLKTAARKLEAATSAAANAFKVSGAKAWKDDQIELLAQTARRDELTMLARRKQFPIVNDLDYLLPNEGEQLRMYFSTLLGDLLVIQSSIAKQLGAAKPDPQLEKDIAECFRCIPSFIKNCGCYHPDASEQLALQDIGRASWKIEAAYNFHKARKSKLSRRTVEFVLNEGMATCAPLFKKYVKK